MTELSRPAPEERFSDRVENYIRYRPGYPVEIVAALERETGISKHGIIADIGSGTGIFTEILLKAGHTVIGVEPNDAMRNAAERLLADYPLFTSVNGKAQSTTLEDASVDLITAAQAFHWFDTPETQTEFTRVLKPGGRIALIWNERKFDSSEFLKTYEALLLRYGTDYAKIRHENIGPEALGRFFPQGYVIHTFASHQVFNFESLKGRLLSSSYIPSPAHPDHEAVLAELRRIYDLYQASDSVTIDYDTRVYLGN